MKFPIYRGQVVVAPVSQSATVSIDTCVNGLISLTGVMILPSSLSEEKENVLTVILETG